MSVDMYMCIYVGGVCVWYHLVVKQLFKHISKYIETTEI